MVTRLLPLVTVVAWDVFDVESARPAFMLIWIGVLTAAVTVWLVRSFVIWSSAVTVLGILAVVRLVTLLGDPPRIMWDGTTDDGRRAFAEVIAEPAPGALLWTGGSLCLIAAGICGFIGQRRKNREHG